MLRLHIPSKRHAMGGYYAQFRAAAMLGFRYMQGMRLSIRLTTLEVLRDASLHFRT
jgi:hypothetical protein